MPKYVIFSLVNKQICYVLHNIYSQPNANTEQTATLNSREKTFFRALCVIQQTKALYKPTSLKKKERRKEDEEQSQRSMMKCSVLA